MILTSAGLGKTELESHIVGMRKVDDLILLSVDVTKPTKWHTRMGLQEEDLRKLVFELMKPANLLFVIRAMLSGKGKKSQQKNIPGEKT
jgi:hypothetical protein